MAAYEFTTLTTVPGVIKYKGAKIQVINITLSPLVHNNICLSSSAAATSLLTYHQHALFYDMT